MWNDAELLSGAEETVKVAEGHREAASPSSIVRDMLVHVSEPKEPNENAVDSPRELNTNMHIPRLQ